MGTLWHPILALGLLALILALAAFKRDFGAFGAGAIFLGVAVGALFALERSWSLGAWLAAAGVFGLPLTLYLAELTRVLPDEPEVEPSFRNAGHHDLIERVGTVRTPLRPSGSVDFGGRAQHALAEDGGFLDAGASVQAVGIRGIYLIVRRFDRDPQPPDSPERRSPSP